MVSEKQLANKGVIWVIVKCPKIVYLIFKISNNNCSSCNCYIVYIKVINVLICRRHYGAKCTSVY